MRISISTFAVDFHLGHLEAVRPMPAVRVSGNFIMCWNITSYKRRYMCRKKGCTYAHTYLEQKAWNRAKKIQTGYFPISKLIGN